MVVVFAPVAVFLWQGLQVVAVAQPEAQAEAEA